MTRRVIFSRQAAQQIEAADLWWSANRLDATKTVRDEIDHVCALLAAHPFLGAVTPSNQRLRRYPLPATSYWLYYRVTDEADRVVRILHTSRRG